MGNLLYVLVIVSVIDVTYANVASCFYYYRKLQASLNAVDNLGGPCAILQRTVLKQSQQKNCKVTTCQHIYIFYTHLEKVYARAYHFSIRKITS